MAFLGTKKVNSLVTSSSRPSKASKSKYTASNNINSALLIVNFKSSWSSLPKFSTLTKVSKFSPQLIKLGLIVRSSILTSSSSLSTLTSSLTESQLVAILSSSKVKI